MKQCQKNHFYDSKYKQCPECKKNWHLLNRDRHLSSIKNWTLSNKEKIKSKNRNWYELNLAHKRAHSINYNKTNPGIRNALSAKYHAQKLKATPKWLSKEQLKEIQEFYLLAKELQWLGDPNDPLEVDHIIPLQGDKVCGLHVPWNLQILPRSLNRKKSNL